MTAGKGRTSTGIEMPRHDRLSGAIGGLVPPFRRRLYASVVFAVLGAAIPLANPVIGQDGYFARLTLSTSAQSDEVSTLAERLAQYLEQDRVLSSLVDELKLQPAMVDGSARSDLWQIIREGFGFANLPFESQHEVIVAGLRDRLVVRHAASGPNAIEITNYAVDEASSLRIVEALGLRAIGFINDSAGSSVNAKLDAARAALNAAQNALTAFEKRIEPQTIDALKQAGLDHEQGQKRLNERRRALQWANDAGSFAEGLSAKAALDTALPNHISFAALRDLQAQYAHAKNAFNDVSSAYGPKHPKFIGAKSNMDAVARRVTNNLKLVRDEAKRQSQLAMSALADEEAAFAKMDEQFQKLGSLPDELLAIESRIAKAQQQYLALSEEAPSMAPQQLASAEIIQGSLYATPRYNWLAVIAYSTFCALLSAGFGWLLFSQKRKRNVRQSDVQPIDEADLSTARVDLVLAEQEAPVLASIDREVSDELPFDEKIKALLMREAKAQAQNSQPSLPPLVKAAVEGRFELSVAQRQELEQLKGDLQELRQALNNNHQQKIRQLVQR